MDIGYMRVSTQDQNMALQKQALEAAECNKIYEDVISGNRQEKTGLGMAMEVLREGDTLIVWKLDRLGRSVKQLVNLVEGLETQKINLRSLTDNIDTSTPSGRFFVHLMASLAEMEWGLIIERTRAGLAAASSEGKVGGRKRIMTESKLASAKKLLDAGEKAKMVAKNLGVSVPTLYRWIPEMGNRTLIPSPNRIISSICYENLYPRPAKTVLFGKLPITGAAH